MNIKKTVRGMENRKIPYINGNKSKILTKETEDLKNERIHIFIQG